MRPYPKIQSSTDQEKAIYNFLHSRARKTSENAFGIMCQYFRIFYSPIAITPTTADYLATAACILHNLLREERIPYPGEETYSEGYDVKLPTINMVSLTRIATNASFEAFEIRNKLTSAVG